MQNLIYSSFTITINVPLISLDTQKFDGTAVFAITNLSTLSTQSRTDYLIFSTIILLG